MKKRLTTWLSLFACLALAVVLLPAPATSAQPRALTDIGVVKSWMASTDGSTVVYTTFSDELRALRVSDRTTTPIGGGPYPHGGLSNYDIVVSPDGAYVAYLKGVNSALELWLVPTDGSAGRVVFNTVPTVLGTLNQSRFTPDGSHLLFLTSPSNATEALYSVASAGNATPVQLNLPPIQTYHVDGYTVSPDSSHVVFTQVISNANTALVNTYSVPTGGPSSASVKLNQNGSSTIFYGDPVITPDSQRVIIPDPGFYSMDLQGGNRVQLSPGGAVHALAVSADSTRIIYGWQNGATMSGEFYVVPIAGPLSAAVQVLSLPRIEIFGVTFTADGSRVLAYVKPLSSSNSSVYSAPSTGPASAAVEIAVGRPIWYGKAYDFGYRPTTHIAFSPPSSSRPYSVPVEGPSGASQQLSPGDIGFSQVTLNGRSFVYNAGGQFYSVPISGPLSLTRNESMIAVGGPTVSDAFQVSSDSSRLFYTAGSVLYVAELGTGSLVAGLLPECQSVTPTAGPTPTMDPTLLQRLYIPAMQRCGGF